MIPVVTEKGEGETNTKSLECTNDPEVQQYMERLRILRAKAGLSPSLSNSTAAVTDSSQNSNVNNDIDPLPTVLSPVCISFIIDLYSRFFFELPLFILNFILPKLDQNLAVKTLNQLYE